MFGVCAICEAHALLLTKTGKYVFTRYQTMLKDSSKFKPNTDRYVINILWYATLLSILLLSAHAASGNELPSHCTEDPDLAKELSQMGPVLGLGSSVSHGLMARSVSEVVADQLCLGNQKNGHAFPLFLPASYSRVIKLYYKRMKPKLVLAWDITYHKMKILEDINDKKKELEVLVAALALDCESELYDCSKNGNASYAMEDDYKPIVLLGDIFYEKLIDCNQRKPHKYYTLENGTTNRLRERCFEEYVQLNYYLRDLAAKYSNVHILPANRLFTALQKYPNSVLYDEGMRQTFFRKRDLTWDGWHPWTDPGSYVFANLTIMQINRWIEEGRIKGRSIPLVKISDKYFGPPSGLIILAPEGFTPVTRPHIVGPSGKKIPLRFSLSEEWAKHHGAFSIGTSYFKARALSWGHLGPKPLLVRAQSFSGTTLVLSKKDQDLLSSHYQQGISLKGGLIIAGTDIYEETVSREDAVFFDQIEEDESILKKLSPPPMPSDASAWTY